jgi:hypothetical protein
MVASAAAGRQQKASSIQHGVGQSRPSRFSGERFSSQFSCLAPVSERKEQNVVPPSSCHGTSAGPSRQESGRVCRKN